MDESRFWLSLWLSLALLIAVLVLGIFYFDMTKTIEMAKLGYEKTTIIGSNYPVYQKGGN